MNTFLLILSCLWIGASSKTITRERFKYLGDVCNLNNNNQQQGQCKFVSECVDYFKKSTEITICGYDRKDSIICCPQTQLTEFRNFTSECVVKETNEKGFLKLIKHCPRIEREVSKGSPFPRVCEHEICRDMVCCPVGGLKRKNEVCFQYDDASYTIQNRIKHEDYCTINGAAGMYKDKAQCKSSPGNQPACDYDFCKNIVCCPLQDVGPFFSNTLQNRKFVDIVGGSCIDERTGEQGICKPSERCHDFSLANRLKYTSCGFEFCLGLVCCPIPKFTSRSLQACEVYKSAVFESVRQIPKLRSTIDPNLQCVEVSPSGGNRASPRQFPNIAALGYQTNNDPIIWNCGGTLISDRFVLTAAHCVNSSEFGPVRFVRLGALTINQPDTLGCPEEFQVIERVVHPSYNTSQRYNDIALIKLDRIVPFTTHIRPACLPTQAALPEKYYFTAMGWGQTGFAEPRTDWLVFVTIQEFNNVECNKFYKDADRLPFGILEETQVCAGSPTSIDDTCPVCL